MNKKIIISSIAGIAIIGSLFILNKPIEHKPQPDLNRHNVYDYGDTSNLLPDGTVEGETLYAVEVKKTTKNVEKPKSKYKIVMKDGIPYEEYRGYLMPPEPDPVENNKTLLGVDVNNNYVRDDIERHYVKVASHKKDFGELMQEARINTMLMINKEGILPAGDLLMKLYAMSPGEGARMGVKNRIGTTDKRKAILRGIVPSGAYETIPSNNFTEFLYRDFSFNDDKDKNLSGYEWNMDFYEDKPFPIYNRLGSIIGFYHNGESNLIRNRSKGCFLNYGVKNSNKCRELSNLRKELFNEKSFKLMKKEGYIKEIYENVQRRLSEGSWDE